METIPPFALDQCMERFDTGIIIRIPCMRITALQRVSQRGTVDKVKKNGLLYDYLLYQL